MTDSQTEGRKGKTNMSSQVGDIIIVLIPYALTQSFNVHVQIPKWVAVSILVESSSISIFCEYKQCRLRQNSTDQGSHRNSKNTIP